MTPHCSCSSYRCRSRSPCTSAGVTGKTASVQPVERRAVAKPASKATSPADAPQSIFTLIDDLIANCSCNDLDTCLPCRARIELGRVHTKWVATEELLSRERHDHNNTKQVLLLMRELEERNP